MLKFISIILFIFLFTYKANSEVVNDIKVINNDRVSKETILIFSKIKIGKDYSQNDLNLIIQDLYSTNFFSNISLEIKNGILIIDVAENKITETMDKVRLSRDIQNPILRLGKSGNTYTQILSNASLNNIKEHTRAVENTKDDMEKEIKRIQRNQLLLLFKK